MSELATVIEYDKPEHDEWHPVYMEHCGYCRSERALPACREKLDEAEKRSAELRAYAGELRRTNPAAFGQVIADLARIMGWTQEPADADPTAERMQDDKTR